MVLALALVLGIALVIGCAPTMLHGMLKLRIEPQIVLVAWLFLVATTVLTAAAALTIVVLPDHGPAPLLLRYLHHGWIALVHGSIPQVHLVVGVLLSTGILGLVFAVGLRLLRHSRRQRGEHQRHLELLRIAARTEAGTFPVMWLPHHRPVAYSVAGAPSFVVATSGVRDQLGEGAAAAVLEHERAHLRGRHHLLIGLAEAVARAAPWLPLMRLSPTLVRTAVELAADRVAARLHGPGAVRSALLHMSSQGDNRQVPSSALGMAEASIEIRLYHLDGPVTKPGRGMRVLASAIIGLAAASLPTLAGIGIMPALTLLSCPFVLEI